MKAAVRVSIVGFDSGEEANKRLDGIAVNKINADLTSEVDITQASMLNENSGIAFRGITKIGKFEITKPIAEKLLASGKNPNSRPNSDVVKPWLNGSDVTGRSRDMWIIDFNEMPMELAAQYVEPFNHVKKHVKPTREKVRRKRRRERWWIYGESAPGMRKATADLPRFIATAQVAKYRLFVWLTHPVVPDQKLIVVGRDDDYFFGVLHSKLHELWSLAIGNGLGDANTPVYTPATIFLTLPFPYSPNNEPFDNPHIKAISLVAHTLVRERDIWLNPPNLSEKELKKRTLTNLYNQRPLWLDKIHKRLDNAVLDAYGWPYDLTDNEILERLLELNLKRSL